MPRLWKFSRKPQVVKNSAAQPQARKDVSSTPTPVSHPVSPKVQDIKPVENGAVRRDLWKEALSSLDDDKKSALILQNAQAGPSITDAIQSVVTTIESLFEEYSNGGWKVKDRDGNVIFDVRENGKRILRFALRSKAIIDSGVKFDPTGCSSSAWAVISLGLQLVQNDQERTSAIFDASAFLTDMLHRYANIEANYCNQDMLDVTELEDRLRLSYQAILNYVFMIQEQQSQRFLGRAWYSLYSLSDQPLQQLKDSILSADNTAEQWRQLIEHEYRLKESEAINKKVEQVCGKLDQILDGLDRNLMAINQVKHVVETILVQMGSKEDIRQMSSFFNQRVAEGLDLPTVARTPKSTDEKDRDSYADSEENLDRLLQEVFVELREFNRDSKQHQRMIEQLPEMSPHKTKNVNLKEVDKIMEWIQSESSQLLLINGNDAIGRYDFNSLFAIPLLLFGESTFEQVLVLRHFCGDNPLFKTNNFRTLVQALVFQILQQRPRAFRDRLPSITRNQTDDITKLWKLFVECVRETRADCTFIIIDSIDYLEDANTQEGFSERELVLQNLDALVKDRGMLIKILLTSSLTPELPTLSFAPELSNPAVDQTALISSPHSPKAAPNRRMSYTIFQDELPLMPLKLIEIQERRCRSLSFSLLYMIYPKNSIIYTVNGDQLHAFIVDHLSGMEELANGAYTALRIRAWSVDHNGKSFAKRYHDFTIPQFPGERSIASFKYIPSGYLADESTHRKKLIARGRRYWELGSGVHYRQVVENGEFVRIVIDQNARPLEPTLSLEDESPVISHDNLKPHILIVCPSTIASYVLGSGTWKTVNIDEVLDVVFQDDLFDHLILPEEQKRTVLDLALWQTETQQQTWSQLGRNRERSGLTILLHGGPGTGKTFTATCVAEKTRRPLLLGSVEMGRSIDEMEQGLNESFQLAERWGAILLLEDIDHFLSQEARKHSSDLSATFTKVIRAIDKHSGVLFLTTCRVGLLDEAILSRTDYTVYYDDLSHSARKKLWHMALQGKVQDQLPWQDHWNQLKGINDLNGRDIQAVVLAAQQLASRHGGTLTLEVVDHILKDRAKFADYLTSVHGKSRDEIAYMKQERAKTKPETGHLQPFMRPGASAPFNIMNPMGRGPWGYPDHRRPPVLPEERAGSGLDVAATDSEGPD